MDEKIIIKSEKSNVVDIICNVILVICCLPLIMVMTGADDPIFIVVAMCLAIVGDVCFIWIKYAYGKGELTVTDKRVYGNAVLGKRVDIPFDSISAVGTSSLFKGVSVASSSGRLVFTAIANNDEIHKAISDLLLERQKKSNYAKQHTTVVKQEVPQSNADELKKYKELLDSGVITQEEFDTKKKQLLGL